MKYKFKIHIAETGTKWFYVEMEDEKYYTLNHFTDGRWTPKKMQEIIIGVQTSAAAEPENSYDWSSEDLFLKSNKYGVFFHDLISQRAGKTSGKQDLTLDHDELIPFLEDFKAFITENS